MSRKIYYSETEIHDMGMKLAELLNHIEEQIEKKKGLVSAYNDSIKAAQKKAIEIAEKINTGYYEAAEQDLQGNLATSTGMQ